MWALAYTPGPLREAVALHRPGPIDPLAHRVTRFSPTLLRERPVLHRRDLEVDVDAVEQRSRHPREVALARRAGRTCRHAAGSPE